MQGPGLMVGRVYAEVGAKLEPSGFERWERRLKESKQQAQRAIAARLGANVDERGFREYRSELRHADDHKPIVTKAGLDVDRGGFDRYQQNTRKAAQHNGDMVKSNGRLRTSFGTVWAKGGAAFAAAGGAYAFGLAGKAVIGTASDINESLTKNKVLFGDYADTVDAFSKRSAKSLGISRAAALEYTGVFGNLFSALGLTKKASADMSMDLTSLASDMASFNNSTPEEALEAIRSALVGETEPIRKFGVNMNDATLKAEALKLAGKGLVDQSKAHATVLDPQTKALAAQALITKQTAAAHGDFARTSGGLANQTRILKAEISDLAGRLGEKLLPFATKVVKGINGIISAFASLGQEDSKLRGLGSAAQGAGSTIGRVLDSIKRSFRAAKDTISGIFSDVKAIFKDSGGDLATIGRAYAKAAEFLSAVFRRALPGIRAVFSGIAMIVRGFVKIIAGILSGDFGKVWDGVKQVFAGGLRLVLGLLRWGTAPFREGASRLAHALTGPFSAVVGFFKRIAKGAIDVMLGMITTNMKALEKMADLASHLPGVGGKFAKLRDQIKDARGEIDRYRESLRDTDKQHDRSGKGTNKLKDDVVVLKRRLGTLKEGTDEYRDTARKLDKKQKELNTTIRDARAAARTAIPGVKQLGDNLLGLGTTADSTGYTIAHNTNRLLIDFGAKPVKYQGGPKGTGRLAVGGIPDPGAGKRDDHVVVGPDGAPKALISGSEGIVNDPQMDEIDRWGQIAYSLGASRYRGLGDLWRSGMRHYAGGGGLGAAAGGGARMVPIPGEPGESIDRRILGDVLALKRKYRLDITDGYAPTGHAAGGEHPLGLAIDAVPGAGGSWGMIGALAKWAEPQQNRPRPPFRWVGYTGDANHGPGNHIHLSWQHAGGRVSTLGGSAAGLGATEIERIIIRGPAGRGKTMLQAHADTETKAANRHLEKALEATLPGLGAALPTNAGGAAHGNYVSTSYGPPWGGIQGTGVTATGINLRGSPHRHIIAVDPSRIPLGSQVKVSPNPFGYSGSFLAGDTGGAIKGNRIDFYDWRGRATQNAWGRRTVNVTKAAHGGLLHRAGGGPLRDSSGAMSPLNKLLRGAQLPLPPGPIEVQVGATNPYGTTSSGATTAGGAIWLKRSNRQDLLHELGHHFDYTKMTDGARNRIRRLLGLKDSWRSGANPPHEKFAEGYRIGANGWPGSGYASYHGGVGYRYRASAKQQTIFDRIVRGVAARFGGGLLPRFAGGGLMGGGGGTAGGLPTSTGLGGGAGYSQGSFVSGIESGSSTTQRRASIAKIEKSIETVQKRYELANRRFDLTDESDMVIEGDAEKGVPPRLDMEKWKRRVSELTKMLGYQRKIAGLRHQEHTYIGQLLAAYRKAQARVRAAIKRIAGAIDRLKGRKGKAASSQRKALEGRLKKYNKSDDTLRARLKTWGDKGTEVGFEAEGSDIDVMEGEKELGALDPGNKGAGLLSEALANYSSQAAGAAGDAAGDAAADNPDLQAQLDQANAKAANLLAQATAQAGVIQAFRGPGDIGSGGQGAFGAAWDSTPVGAGSTQGAPLAAGSTTSLQPGLYLMRLDDPEAQEALAGATVGGLSRQAYTPTSRESI